MTRDNPLYGALKQLSEDIRLLVELSNEVTADSWEQMLETVKKEMHDEALQQGQAKSRSEDVVLRALMSEIYDHLNVFIRSIQRSQNRLRKLATRDLLTGLYNRNYFNETIVRDIQKAERNNEKLSFLLIDIDDFKRINDEYGHLHGDGVIKACAGILRNSVRKSDFLCRYGGDEFVIVTPMSDCEANEALLERIQELLDEWNNEYSTFDYRLSFSIGCSAWEEGRDILDVLHEADKKMYQDKARKKI
jgi:diguanylate cyclase (GGDEF)-like protein